MRTISFQMPRKICIGRGCLHSVAEHVSRSGQRVHIIGSPSATTASEELKRAFSARHIDCTADMSIAGEPTIATFRAALSAARRYSPDSVIGIGGGSALDVAKLVAAFAHSSQDVTAAFGIDLLQGRSTQLVCIPTTSGTGSETSPNAILLDETENLKKGIISPFLVPDASFIDPMLMASMPAPVTATTGFDALTHCIEAYTNKFSHPAVDVYALEGVRLIAAHLSQAVACPDDLDAREAMALASFYGGLCLGPVNTAAVHALAYPLGSRFHVAHGLSNALLLPFVFAFNIPACPRRHADIALALGVSPRKCDEETAWGAVEQIATLINQCNLKLGFAAHGIPEDAIIEMSSSAMTVTRLLKNNPREVTLPDAEFLYRCAFKGLPAAGLREALAARTAGHQPELNTDDFNHDS